MDKKPSSNQLDNFDHVVVLMLENRSFDNLLGSLYKPGDIKDGFPLGKKFAGLLFDGPHGNPIPKKSQGKHGHTIYPKRARDYFQPYPDPGEFYPHINTQLYGQFIPQSNEGQEDKKIIAPFNLPDPLPEKAPMNGFVADYISVLQGLEKQGCLTSVFNFLGLNPKKFKLNDRYDDFKSIMECYEPDQVPVMTKLAREFAVFDHWHCDVPSQTYTNRAFWHSGTSYGYVNNSPISNWLSSKNGPTLFNRLQDKKIPWKIYTDNPVSLTGIVHFHQLLDFHKTNFKSFSSFLKDAANGELPAYSFIEPRFFTPNNDQHPASYDSVLFRESKIGSVWLGEELIRDVYNAIKDSSCEPGNNWKNTLLIITHDEHGGCFDHVPPSPHFVCTPENPPAPEQDGFIFNRLGVRVPMIMVSAHIKRHTIVNNDFRHTSFLRTMCKKWGLEGFTDRDKTAPEFTEVFTADDIRDRSDWPTFHEFQGAVNLAEHDFSGVPLNDLQKVMLSAVSHWKYGSTEKAEALNTTKEALDFLDFFEGELPGAAKEELKWR